MALYNYLTYTMYNVDGVPSSTIGLLGCTYPAAGSFIHYNRQSENSLAVLSLQHIPRMKYTEYPI